MQKKKKAPEAVEPVASPPGRKEPMEHAGF